MSCISKAPSIWRGFTATFAAVFFVYFVPPAAPYRQDNLLSFAAFRLPRSFKPVAILSDYDLHSDKNGLYFEYGVAGKEHIHIDDFEEVE